MDPGCASLTDRTALITGAGAGIGRGIALAMARFGARVAALDLNPETASRTAEEINDAGGDALALPGDARDPDAIGHALEVATDQFGPVDVLVNNAGGTFPATKAGAISITRTLALELAPHDIRVNAIAPDICLTEGLEAMVPAEERGRWADIVPLARAATPDDIAGPAVFLASDLARYVTGITLHVDGGTHAAGGWYHDPAGGWVLGPPRGR